MKVEVQIDENSLTAQILIRKDKEESVSELTEEDLNTILEVKAINTGIDSHALKKIISDKIYNHAVRVANGIPPGDGENARVEILKKPEKKKVLALSNTKDDSIDYYSPRKGFIVYARKDDVLAVKYPPTRGKPGKNVFEEEIPGLLGKEISLELFKGKNTRIADNKIIAESDGIIELAGLQLNVLKTYEIDDNLGKNTGSIDLPHSLNCKLVIKGDVQSGYSVSCSDLYVYGCVEDAAVTVKNLEVKEGIVGVGKRIVTAQNIKVGYINGSREIFAKNITVLKEISNGAKVYANVVKAYAIQGSTVIARDAIWTNHINGDNSLAVGFDYKAKLEYDKLHIKILSFENVLKGLKEQDFLNTKRMKKLAELARINPQHPSLQKELPEIKATKIKLDNILKLRAESAKEKENHASRMYSQRAPFLLVRSNFGKDNSIGHMVDPNITIRLKDKSLKISDTEPGGLFTIGSHGIDYTSKYNIKEIKKELDKYFIEIDVDKKFIIEKIDTLPTLPVIMMKILECIDDPHSSAEDLKNIISKDPPTAAKVLSLANSAYYGYTRTIEDVMRAIVILGFETIIDVALSVSLSTILIPTKNSLAISMEKLWGHCIAAAEACRLCAIENFYPYKERAFLIGLIHDIGKIAYACFFPEEFSKAVEDARFEEKYIYDTEKQVLGFSHSDAGIWLADKWNLPYTISVPIQFHHEPEKAPEEYKQEAVLAHFADYLVKFSNIGDSGDNNKLPELSPLVKSQMGISEEDIDILSQKLVELQPKIEVFTGSVL